MHACIEAARMPAAPAAARTRWANEPQPAGRDALLARYLEGWAETNIAKIIAATAPDYRFDDPLVGRFVPWSLGDYLAELRRRFARAGSVTRADLNFHISGPIASRRLPRSPGVECLEFFREAPRLVLTGSTTITINEHGVTGERVAYDLNLALARRRRV
jgi:hypothetical protein